MIILRQRQSLCGTCFDHCATWLKRKSHSHYTEAQRPSRVIDMFHGLWPLTTNPTAQRVHCCELPLWAELSYDTPIDRSDEDLSA